jgi:16S rRNA (cytidine1402-2'-O)-methyltransferase
MEQKKGKLYLVSTPIGNRCDMSERGLDTLRAVSRVAAEDTRVTGQLLDYFAIKKPLVSLHQHNERSRVEQLATWLSSGESLALVSDAGTPVISDPGHVLVRELAALGFEIVPVPGACAFVAALSASGLPSEHFWFEGFLPSQSGARVKRLTQLKGLDSTLIFYESCHRVVDSIKDMQKVFEMGAQVCLAKELTKLYETFVRGDFAQVLAWLEAESVRQKGEFVLLVYPEIKVDEDLPQAAQDLLRLLVAEMPLKKAAGVVATHYDLRKNALYQWGLDHL